MTPADPGRKKALVTEGLFVFTAVAAGKTPPTRAFGRRYTPIIDTDLVFRYDSIASGPPSEP
jgi:hypothetical protein